MDSYTRGTGNSSEDESEASLLEVLREMASYGSEAAVSENNSVNWSEEALLSESDTEAGAALKVTAQPVEQIKTHVGMTSQNSVEQKTKEDTQTNKVSSSVFKAKEEMEIDK